MACGDRELTMAGHAAAAFHTLRLTYFDGPGRADPVRWALRYGGVAFEDERLSVAEWDDMKESGDRDVPLQQLPLLTVNTVV
jgi:glutathione S-transferase